MTPKKVCFVTGSRAEYGLLYWLLKKTQSDPELVLQIICCNMHLSPEFGLTYKQIEADGFVIDKKIEMLLSSDTPTGTVKSLGLGIIGFADAYAELRPDMVVLLGDRYEILGAASAALISRIPITHIHGGEITEGAYDDSIRHAVTKMSHLHFTSTEDYRQRVLQLGEDVTRVFNVGALGIENIKRMDLLSREEFARAIDFRLLERNMLITYHPVTLEAEAGLEQFDQVLKALNEFQDIGLIFTYSNSDSQGREITAKILEFVKANEDHAIAIPSLGQLRYISALKHVNAVVGNSSSGIIEAPFFNTPVVNIGNRQKGRIQAASTINCPPDANLIKEAIKKAMSAKSENAVKNPYEQPGTVEKIIREIKLFFSSFGDSASVKKFNDLK